MKVNGLIVSFLKVLMEKDNKKRRKTFPEHDPNFEKVDVPYAQDDNFYHRFDVFYPKDMRKRLCIIDIHGGAYVGGSRKENFKFGTKFTEQGFDFIAIDYIPADGKRSTKDQIDECAQAIQYIFEHKTELNLEEDRFVLMGDSAGGHFALLLAEAVCDKKFAAELGYSFDRVEFLGVLINCPVYDYANIGETMAKSGNKRMFGPKFFNEDYRNLISPKTHIDSLTIPLFLSTCLNDFLRAQSMQLNEDMQRKSNKYEFLDLQIEDKSVAHVHNLIVPDQEESVQVNNAMMRFIEELL